MKTASSSLPGHPAPDRRVSPAGRPSSGSAVGPAVRRGLPPRYRLKVLGRIVLAVFGGYAVAAALAAGLSLWLPALGWMPRLDATLLATMLAFLIHAVLAIAVFSCTSERKALATVLVPGIVLGLALAFTWPGATT